MIIMEEKLKTIADNINSYISDEMAKVEKANNIKKELDSELERLNEFRIKRYQVRDKEIEEANKKADEDVAEETNRVFLKYEDKLKEFSGGIVQKEQPLENFDIPNMEINKEEKQEISHDLENELFNQTKEDNYTDIVSNDSTNVVIENNDENKEEEQPEFTPVSDPQVSVDFENGASEESTIIDANVEETPVVENESQIETSEPIQVTAIEDGADVIAKLGSVEQEKTQDTAPKLEEETNENTEVNNEVVNAAPGTDVFVGSLPAEFAQVANSQQEAVQETAPVEEVAQEQPISNVELSSGFTDIIDSMEQGRARVHTPNN